MEEKLEHLVTLNLRKQELVSISLLNDICVEAEAMSSHQNGLILNNKQVLRTLQKVRHLHIL